MVTIAENIEILEAIRARVAVSAGPVATEMAKYIAERTRNDTLQRTKHPPGGWRRAKPGDPPASASGRLAAAMEHVPAHDGVRATAITRNEAEYARILEFGCRVVPHDHPFLHWIDSRGSWFHDFLDIPAHPFLGRTTDEALDDNGLLAAAIEAFKKYDP